MTTNKTLKGVLVVWMILLAGAMFGCRPGELLATPVSIPQPTPTGHALFSDSQQPEPTSTVQEGSAVQPQSAPTVAPFFQPIEDLPQLFSLGAGARPTQLPARTPQVASDIPTKTLSIYEDSLSQNWSVLQEGELEVDLAVASPVHRGQSALKATPNEDFAKLIFAVKPTSSEQYLRSQVLGVSFWINSGEGFIDLEDLGVAVVGSNAYPYYLAGDSSVTNRYDPVFSETRLYYLNFNRSIPPNTWVEVQVWLDELIYDPIYTYLTGFYIKNDVAFTQTYFIDDVKLILIDQKELQRRQTQQSAEEASGVESSVQQDGPVRISVAVTQPLHTISPMIYGVSGADITYTQKLNPGLNSWGGNPSTRYNWRIGHAWNAGSDWFYRNGNYGITEGSASDSFISETLSISAEVRLAVPTLGWVAKNDDLDTCSFPLPDGTCGDGNQSNCNNPRQIADPKLANVQSTPEDIAEWMRYLFDEKKFRVRFIAMDNEPELWGFTHYDVHPECTTYKEILDKYLTYAQAVRSVAPEAELTGPVTCCWFYYWNSAAGILDKALYGNQDFLPWFLDNVNAFDTINNTRSLDVLDIHYYPDGLYNDQVDAETAAHRLRSPRSLWDATYVDESWIGEPVNLIPRMKKLIADHYPGLKLGISEWNFGADEHMNGALAIADVLGTFGKEDVYFAAYWMFPPPESPGFFAFRMYSNYDGQGSRFGGAALPTESTHWDHVSSYAALDEQGRLLLMLVNKKSGAASEVWLDLQGFEPRTPVDMYRYEERARSFIQKSQLKVDLGNTPVLLPANSITLLVMEAANP